MSSSPQMQRSFQDVLQDIIGNVQQIIKYEFRLAKTEIKEQVTKAAGPTMTLAVGLALGFYALGFLLLAVVYAFSLVMPGWGAALLVGVVLAIVAASVASASATKLKKMNFAPEKTASTLEENAEWAKHQIK
jgi:uncharacterized membrane protein YqjE